MSPAERPSPRRGGFTLVEMLVVIAIIGILVALVAPAIFSYLKKGPQTVTQSEIDQLNVAIQDFKLKWKVDYIPSYIKLCEKFGDYDQTQQLDVDSIGYLTKLWPHLLDTDPTVVVNGQPQVRWSVVGIDWNGDGVIDNRNNAAGKAARTFVLEGHQCLVYFLGGVPTQSGGVNGVLGFSTDARDPVKLSQTAGRKNPSFEFKAERLILVGTTKFFSYADAYGKGKPYVYFSNFGSRNNYGPYKNAQGKILDNWGQGVEPYFEAATPLRYINASTYQILSAGADSTFGPGGLWTPPTAGTIAAAGKDDLSNFNTGLLMGVSP